MSFIPTPDLAFIAPRHEPWLLEGARLLVNVLGCPQVVVRTEEEPLPESVRVVVLLSDFVDIKPFEHFIVWRLVDGQRVRAPAFKFDSRALGELPNAAEHEIVFNGFGEQATLLNIARGTLYYAINAIKKAPAEKRNAMFSQWLVCRTMAVSNDTSDTYWGETLAALADFCATPQEPAALSQLVQQEVRKTENEFLISFFAQPTNDAFRSVRRCFHGSPHWLPLFAFVQRSTPRLVTALIKYLEPAMNSSERKAAVGCAYRLTGNENAATRILNELVSSDWRVPGSCLIRTLRDKPTVSRGPVLLAFIVSELIRSGCTESLAFPALRTPLAWCVLESCSGSRPIVDDFVQLTERKIASCLFQNWLRLQEIPNIQRGHFFLSDQRYEPFLYALEKIWIRWLHCALAQAGRPTIRLKPWPAGHKFALSLRFDVDRFVSTTQVRKILAFQRKRCRSACGSWYFLSNEPFNDIIKQSLQGRNQEEGVHIRQPADAQPGRGATAHSGANSEYWRGRRTIRFLQQAGATYGEAMTYPFAIPRPGWLGRSRSHLWLTPLHFPLEGSTSDTDTSYFDQRLDAFHRQIDAGGLVIIGSHPDCDLKILKQVFSREHFDRCWNVSVGRAVSRARSILDDGAVVVGRDPSHAGNLCLRSRNAIADLEVEITCASDLSQHVITMQLIAGVPRAVKVASVKRGV